MPKRDWKAYGLIIRDGGRYVCRVEHYPILDDTAQRPTEKEDVALIAAAPELLESLKEEYSVVSEAQRLLREWIVPDSGISDHNVLNSLLGILDAPRLNARAAIAKATGE